MPIKWGVLKTVENSPVPPPRIYHACSICKYGGALNMIIVYGGRNDKGIPLNDCWGLRKHRNGTWDWVLAPYDEGYEPQKRFQHSITFFYNFLIVIGGRNNSENKQIPIEIYDTQTSKWVSVAFFNKFRHTTWIVDDSIYTHGGFQLNNTSVAQSDIIKIDLTKLFNSNDLLKTKFEELKNKLKEEKEKKQKEFIVNTQKITPTISPEGGVRGKYESRQTYKKHQEKLHNIKEQNQLPMSSINEKPLIQKIGEIAMASSNKDEKIIIKTIAFDEKWGIKQNFVRNKKDKNLCDIFIDALLKPEQWVKDTHNYENEKFIFNIEQIAALTKQCIEIVAKQPNILKVSAPVKVFGDIHGQYIDLMNFLLNGALQVRDPMVILWQMIIYF